MAVIVGAIIARMVTPAEYGSYGYVLSVVTIFCAPVICGIQPFSAKKIAGLAGGAVNRCTEYVRLLQLHSLFIGFLSTCLLLSYAYLSGQLTTAAILLACMLLLARVVMSNTSSVLYGLEFYTLAQAGALLLVPGSMLLLLLISNLLHLQLNVIRLLAFSVTSTVIAAIFTYVALRRRWSRGDIKSGSVSCSVFFNWYRELLPFSFMAVLLVLNTEYFTVALAWLSTTEHIAYFRIAVQGAAVLSLYSVATNYVLNPKIARLYMSQALDECQKLLTISVRLNFLVAAPLAALVYFYGKPLLILIFGMEYQDAYLPMMILTLAHLINVLTGAVGVVLNMSGNEKITVKTLVYTMLLTVPVSLFAINLAGSVGAAIGVGSGIIIWNVLMMFKAKELTKLKTYIR